MPGKNIMRRTRSENFPHPSVIANLRLRQRLRVLNLFPFECRLPKYGYPYSQIIPTNLETDFRLSKHRHAPWIKKAAFKTRKENKFAVKKRMLFKSKKPAFKTRFYIVGNINKFLGFPLLNLISAGILQKIFCFRLHLTKLRASAGAAFRR